MKFYNKYKNSILIFGGVIISLVVLIPYFILGENSYVEIHDQLDGEVLNYIFTSKYLFKGGIINEFMNGANKASMTPPAPLYVLFYLLFKPFKAYVAGLFLSVVVGFLGMYFLLVKLSLRKEIAFIVAILFTYMPFYPVYGLAAWGQPMLILGVLKLLETRKEVWAYLCIILYGMGSSLSLVGYAFVGFGIILTIYFIIRKNKEMLKGMFISTVLLTFIYLMCNIDLVKAMCGMGFESHRSEMVLFPNNFLGTFLDLLLNGGAYSKTYSRVILVVAVFIFILKIVYKKINAYRFKCFMGLMVFLIVGSLLAALWGSDIICRVRVLLGGPFLYFQADRIYWIFPFVCMVILAFEAEILTDIAVGVKNKIVSYGIIATAVVLILIEALQIARDSTLNKNARLLLVDNYEQITWSSFFMEDVFERIGAATGSKEDYSVVSLGMYPSIALYNGYTCADGYSNFYDVNYKHEFRTILGLELEKNDAVRKYFDDWGNRLYLANAQYGFNMLLGKKNMLKLSDLEYDMEAMKSLNIKYIFSACEILDEENLGIKLVEGSPFSTKNSYYEVWVYELD